jgi:hypothetical protein
MERKDVIINVTGVQSSGSAQLKESEVNVDKGSSRQDKERTFDEKKSNSN